MKSFTQFNMEIAVIPKPNNGIETHYPHEFRTVRRINPVNTKKGSYSLRMTWVFEVLNYVVNKP